MKGFINCSLQALQIVYQIDFGPTHTGQEVFFQKREGATEEDDGYLMTTVHDWNTDESKFVIWDSKNLSEQPIMKAKLKARVPNGFHSTFVAEDQMEK